MTLFLNRSSSSKLIDISSCTHAIRATSAFVVIGMIIVEGASTILRDTCNLCNFIHIASLQPSLLPACITFGRTTGLCNASFSSDSSPWLPLQLGLQRMLLAYVYLISAQHRLHCSLTLLDFCFDSQALSGINLPGNPSKLFLVFVSNKFVSWN